MKKNTTYLSIGIVFVLIGLSVFALLKTQSGEERSRDHIQVITSFYPLAYLASSVGGELVNVETMTPNGAEPHDFEPTARDIAHLSSADIFLYNGAGFEPWIDAWNKGAFARPEQVVDMIARLKGENISLQSEDGVTDPHVWLDPLLYARQAEIVRDALIQADPINESVYRARTETLVQALVLLDQDFRSGLASCLTSDVIVSHDAFGYPAQAYNFNLINIAGMSPDEEPSPQTLALIIDKARAKNINHIFFETSVSPRLANTIAREVGATTLLLHTLESLSVDEVQSGQDYLSIMRQNLANLRTARACN